ncbi:MAG: DUF4157 domain-containing protein [Nitrospira sp.]|nr:DUF4157 domain-containing protein [Nitrospira sp.]
MLSDKAYNQRRQNSFMPFTPVSHGMLQRKCACGTHTMGSECESCRKNNLSLQRKAPDSRLSTQHPDVVPPIVHEVLRSTGHPLDLATRDFFEPRFGRDFSQVRVHTGDEASRSAEAVDALAYTVGNNVVFGRGQYRPDTAVGCRLLAHELTHTEQQGEGIHTSLQVGELDDQLEREADRMAEAALRSPELDATGATHTVGHEGDTNGVLQRTPAPPSYGGVTGVQDLSKIRIDAVPDFLASGLTAPRVVNVHVADPAVVHITWMLYDPNDQMMSGSYSTRPGFPDSTSRPFTLQPSHFSGTGFIEGKYLLRCAGLNASHQPVVYADRDFNVLRTDLTTGTALPTTYGELTFTRYAKTDASPPANPRYSIDVELRFLPSTTVTCSEVGFIQSMQTIDNQGRSQQNTVNSEQDARKTPLAWSIDRLAGGPTPFYGTERGANGAITIPASKGALGSGGPTPAAARLVDQPSWNRLNNAKFESCAICRSGGNRGQVYGCATWGYTANASGQVTLMPRGFRQMPSDQFEEARAAWNTWRSSVPAATRPEEAPSLTRP